jgi:hypothetical protein
MHGELITGSLTFAPGKQARTARFAFTRMGFNQYCAVRSNFPPINLFFR